MRQFSPPVRYPYPRFDPRETAAGKRLYSRSQGSPEGITVYVLTDNSVTQVKPGDESRIAVTYRGGYLHQIDNAAAAILIAAGYEVTGDAEPYTWDDLSQYTWDEAFALFDWDFS